MKKNIIILTIILTLFSINVYSSDLQIECEIIDKGDNFVYQYNDKDIFLGSNGREENIWWTGKEYIWFNDLNGKYEKSTDASNWEDLYIQPDVSDKLFNLDYMEICYCDGVYIARSSLYDSPIQIISALEHDMLNTGFDPVYCLNENFETIGETNFEYPVTAFSYYDGRFYIRTQDYKTNYAENTYVVSNSEHQPINYVYVSNDGISWNLDEYLQEVPLYSDGKLMTFGKGNYVREKYSDLYYSLNDISVGFENNSSAKVIYEQTPFGSFSVVDGLFLSYDGLERNKKPVPYFSVSNDGVYWYNVKFPDFYDGEILTRVFEFKDSFLFKTGKRLFRYDLDDIKKELSGDPIYIKLNGNILGFAQPPVMESDRILVPMRFLFEQMGAEVNWNDETQTAIATSARDEGENTVTFSIDNTTAYVNGAETPMDVPAHLIDDQTFVPLRFLSENLGYTVEWDEAANTAVITTE